MASRARSPTARRMRALLPHRLSYVYGDGVRVDPVLISIRKVRVVPVVGSQHDGYPPWEVQLDCKSPPCETLCSALPAWGWEYILAPKTLGQEGALLTLGPAHKQPYLTNFKLVFLGNCSTEAKLKTIFVFVSLTPLSNIIVCFNQRNQINICRKCVPFSSLTYPTAGG